MEQPISAAKKTKRVTATKKPTARGAGKKSAPTQPKARVAKAGGKAAAAKALAKARATDALLKLVEQSLDEDKAVEVATIALAGKTTIADYMVVASGRSQRQVGAMADHMVRRLKKAGYGSVQVEGMPQNDWVLVDAGDVIVHLFRPEVRTFYNLEKMWAADFAAFSEAERALG